jgi:hypothetical protein
MKALTLGAVKDVNPPSYSVYCKTCMKKYNVFVNLFYSHLKSTSEI